MVRYRRHGSRKVDGTGCCPPPTDPVGVSSDYRNVMSLRPVWTSANLMIYPTFGTSSNGTPGIWARNLAGVIN